MNLDRFLSPLSVEQPGGVDLDDTNFLFPLDFSDPSRIPEGADGWRRVVDAVEEGFGQSRDLRLAVSAAVAGLHLEGVAGFAQGLRFLRRFLEEGWDTIYPPVDDPENALRRVSIVFSLKSQTYVVRPFARATLVAPAGGKGPSLLDIEVSEGRRELPEGDNREVPSPASIASAFEALGPAGIQALVELLGGMLEDLQAIDSLFEAKAPASGAPSLDVLMDEIRRARVLAVARLPEEPLSESADGQSDAAGEEVVAVTASTTTSATGEIRSRKDAVRALERVAKYFRENEPTSPVPYLLDRAVRLTEADFLAIVEELAPDALDAAAKLLRGLAGKDK